MERIDLDAERRKRRGPRRPLELTKEQKDQKIVDGLNAAVLADIENRKKTGEPEGIEKEE